MPAPTQVVFIPALLCDAALYAEAIESLGAAIEPHVLSAPLPTLEASVADILARAPEKFALVGTSYGGNLAIEIALAAPERVTALWLMGCDPGAPMAGGPDLVGGLAAAPETVIGLLSGAVVHKDAASARQAFIDMARRVGGAAGSAQAAALKARRETRSRLRALTMPALVLWGEDDALVPMKTGRALADALPHAHFHALSGCGHLPTLEKPEESAALFAEFLAGEAHGH
jgi:pimeloyl-ACP methyl ester carboxylesterase